ncbi:hypothetical protein [Pectobacterium parvum]|uniref:hypothetical protein n=1 Tax=Pectobacterium parvum TaxID=2778550 RepID=UPI00381B761B
MAKYKVLGYNLAIRDNGNGYPNLYLDTSLQNSASNVSQRQYRIASDTRHPDIMQIHNHLSSGFQSAMQNGLSVEISEFKERMYLFIKTPTSAQMQYSGCREK